MLLVTAALCIPLERWFAPKRVLTRQERFSDLLHAMINPIVNSASGITAIVLVVVALDFLGLASIFFELTRHSSRLVRRQPFLIQFAGATLLSGFLGYWTHRAFHRFRFLWRFHAVHHSSHVVDWLSTHRQHPVEVAIVAAVTLFPIFALGFGDASLVGFVLFRKFHVFLSHTRIDWGFGPLKWLIVSPRFHHWHHEPNSQCNYAGLFPFLDKLFGTYQRAKSLPSETGTHTHVHSGYLQHLLHPLATPSSMCLQCSRPLPNSPLG